MKKLFITTIAIAIIGGVVFYACKKDNNELLTNENKAKITKNGQLVNPFEQAGIWHNECIKHIVSQENTVDLTNNELWQAHGAPFFQNILGTDYIPVTTNELSIIYEKAKQDVDEKRFLTILEELVEENQIFPNYELFNGQRNNYEILLEYFTFLTNYNVESKGAYWTVYNKTCIMEQEVLSNYYDLLEDEIISPNDETDNIYAEYAGILFSMAIVRNSILLWAPPSSASSACYALPLRTAYIDGVSAYGTVYTYGWVTGYIGRYSSISAFCSAMAGRQDVAIYVDGVLVSGY